MNNLAKSNEISVVVQGPISNLTKNTLLSVRKYLPDAEIILSTWKNSNVDNLEFDTLILNDDPYANSSKKYPTNINRMLVSTINGLKAVKRKYLLKIRTDFELTGTNFLNLFAYDSAPSKELRFFEQRVVAFVWKPQAGRLFHIGDFHFFGLTRDLLALFNIPLATDEESFYMQNNRPLNKRLKKENPNKYHPEQHIWINFLENNGINVPLQDYTDFTSEMKNLTERTFANNLIFASFYEFSIKTKKENLLRYNLPFQSRCYKFSDWVKLYKKHINQSFIPNYTPLTPPFFNSSTSLLFFLIGRLLSNFIPIQKYRRKIRKTFEKISLHYL